MLTPHVAANIFRTPCSLKYHEKCLFCRGETPAFYEAVGLLVKRTTDGHPDSMTKLGQSMYYGDEMDQDKAGGLDMLHNVTKDGSYFAYYILGAILVGDDDDAARQYDELL